MSLTNHDVGLRTNIVWKDSFRIWLTCFGPTAILVSISIGPGTIASNLAAGSLIGYNIAWLVALTAIWSVINIYVVGKITCVTGLSVIEQFSTFFHPAVSWVIGGLLLITLLVLTPISGVMLGHSFNFMFPSVSPFMGTTICFGIIVYVYIYGGGFRYVTTVCSILVAIMSVAFLINSIMVKPDLPALALGLVVPSIPQGKENTLLALGIFGGSVSILGSLFQSYSVRNAGWSTQQVPVMAWDAVIFGGAVFTIFSLSILVSGVALAGKPVHEVTEAAIALEPIAGPFARWLFAIGFFIATFTSVAAASYSAGYIIHDFYKWRLANELHCDKRFRAICVLFLSTVFLAPLVANLFPPMYLIIFGLGLFTIGTPPVVILTLILARRKDVMGKHRLGFPLSILMGCLVIASFCGAYAFVTRILSQFA